MWWFPRILNVIRRSGELKVTGPITGRAVNKHNHLFSTKNKRVYAIVLSSAIVDFANAARHAASWTLHAVRGFKSCSTLIWFQIAITLIQFGGFISASIPSQQSTDQMCSYSVNRILVNFHFTVNRSDLLLI